MNLVKFYFVYSGNLQEREIIMELKPPNLLLSYFYFKHKSISEVIEELGYKPNIILDSGAFSAKNKGIILDMDTYQNYVKENENFVEHYIAPDVMHDGEATFERFLIMKENGFNPVPVFHYQTDEKWIKKYADMGERFIALGSTVPEKKKELVRIWINELSTKYLSMDFHVLGTSNRRIIDFCDVLSCDSTGWIITANMKGKSRNERDILARKHMRRIMSFTC